MSGGDSVKQRGLRRIGFGFGLDRLRRKGGQDPKLDSRLVRHKDGISGSSLFSVKHGNEPLCPLDHGTVSALHGVGQVGGGDHGDRIAEGEKPVIKAPEQIEVVL